MGRQQGRKGGGGKGAFRAGRDGKDTAAGEKRQRDDVWHMDQRDQSQLENPAFERYYKEQVFMQSLPDYGVWDATFASFRVPLPMATRVNRNHPDRGLISKLLVSEFEHNGFPDEKKAAADSTAAAEDNAAAPAAFLRTLPFIAENLGMQVPLSRGEVKRQSDFKRLKRILASFNEAGMLTRQETVSMVPPLMLDVKPGMRVLDMCAAPGSKTSQLLEALVSGGYENTAASSVTNADGTAPLIKDTFDVTKAHGVVVANDVNIARIDVLTHQTGRAPHSHPNLIITNNDATNYPLIINPDDKFDRVLCDVMCSGDGTLRKSLDLWSRWNPHQGADLHNSQLRTLLRGMSLVKAGGVVVYSTCSLNPIEDEAVIAEALLQAKGAFELIDPTVDSDDLAKVSESGSASSDDAAFDKNQSAAPANAGPYRVVRRLAPGLRYSPGVTSWKISNKEGDKFFETFAEAAEYRREVMKEKGFQYRPSMFPPRPDSAEQCELFKALISEDGEVKEGAATGTLADLHLERSMRILPHLQDTGGFFVAALRCKRDFCAQEVSATRRFRQLEEIRAAESEIAAAKATGSENSGINYKNLPYVPVAGSAIEKSLVSVMNLDPAVFPFDRLFIRREGFAQLTGAPYGGTASDAAGSSGYDSDGNPVTAGRPPRVAKLFLATKEAAEMMSKLPPSIIIKQIGIKAMESYAKYSNDRFRIFAESFDTVLPYLVRQMKINGAANPSAAADDTSANLLQRSFVARAPNVEALEWLMSIQEKSNGRSTLSDFINHVEVCEISTSSVSASSSSSVPSFTCKKVASAAEWKQTMARKSFAVMCPMFIKPSSAADDAIDASQKFMQRTLFSMSPIPVAAELDDAQMYIQIKILPHHMAMFRLSLTGASEDPNNAKNQQQQRTAAVATATADGDIPANPKSRERDEEEEEKPSAEDEASA